MLVVESLSLQTFKDRLDAALRRHRVECHDAADMGAFDPRPDSMISEDFSNLIPGLAPLRI